MGEGGPRPPTSSRRKPRPNLELPAYFRKRAGGDPAKPGSKAAYDSGSPWPNPGAPTPEGPYGE
eukprot:181120-Amphidinium_carterae.2